MTLYSLDGTAPELAADGSIWIAPDAHVMGKVRLGRAVGIWFGAVLRGDNEWIEVGDGSNIQEHCMLHTDMGFPVTVGADVTVGHRAILHGCTVGAGSLIGMGATVLNGAVIGEGCLIGAGALVTEGKEIPAGSLVMGAPAKVVRAVDAGTRQALIGSAESYQANARRFRDGLVELSEAAAVAPASATG
ncbi:MAG: gamma carbonic anhydrase family protein [Pseudomonadota bacterium]